MNNRPLNDILGSYLADVNTHAFNVDDEDIVNTDIYKGYQESLMDVGKQILDNDNIDISTTVERVCTMKVAKCQACNNGELYHNGYAIAHNDKTLYRHICSHCGQITYLPSIYPLVLSTKTDDGKILKFKDKQCEIIEDKQNNDE